VQPCTCSAGARGALEGHENNLRDGPDFRVAQTDLRRNAQTSKAAMHSMERSCAPIVANKKPASSPARVS
jgi:hypothetical protein